MQFKVNDALLFLVNEEGGLVNHKDDPGGITKYGISKKEYPDVDIASLTKEQACEIYMRDYWPKLPADIPDSIKVVAFDFGVNAGISRAIKTLQKAIGTDPDGKWGQSSKAALSAHKERDVLINFTVERQMFYSSLPTFPVFGKGWLRRTLRAHDFASKFLSGASHV